MTGLEDMMDANRQRHEQIVFSQQLNKIAGIKRELHNEEKDDKFFLAGNKDILEKEYSHEF